MDTTNTVPASCSNREAFACSAPIAQGLQTREMTPAHLAAASVAAILLTSMRCPDGAALLKRVATATESAPAGADLDAVAFDAAAAAVLPLLNADPVRRELIVANQIMDEILPALGELLIAHTQGRREEVQRLLDEMARNRVELEDAPAKPAGRLVH